MTLTKALKLLNKIDKGKISHYLEDCIDYEERNLGVMRKNKVYGLIEFYVDEEGENADEAVPLLDCRFWQKDNKGEIIPASLTAGDILAKDWECVFVDACGDLNCTIREYLQDKYLEIMYRDEIAKLDTRDLLKDKVKKIEIVDVLQDKAIIEMPLENPLYKGVFLSFVDFAKEYLKKDLPYIVVCYDKECDSFELERME